jgi:signal transduction histidine kinase
MAASRVLLTGEAAASGAAQAGSEHHDESEGLVMVIDGDAGSCAILRQRLERLGHRVVTTSSGADALALLAGQGFDLILLDLVLPEMDGLEVLRRLKADPAIAATPVVIVSALDDIERIALCIELGAEDYLPKQANVTLLNARVSASLRSSRARYREAMLHEQESRNFERLRQAEGMRDDLMHMIVHDLRTPLTSLLSGLQSVPVLGPLTGDQAEMLEIAMSGGETLLGMVNDLLDVGKMEDGSLHLEVTSIDPVALIGRAVSQVALLARAKRVLLLIDMTLLPDDPAPVEGDEDKLRRTIVNLIGNAIKFTPEGGSVTVGARRDADGTMHFSVRDTGEGIPREAFRRIFDKFGQVESRKAGRSMSTGLGLTFCRMAVEAHGGHIHVESELGRGSTFSFTVPPPRDSAAVTDSPA